MTVIREAREDRQALTRTVGRGSYCQVNGLDS